MPSKKSPSVSPTAFTIAYCYGETTREVLYAFGHHDSATMARSLTRSGMRVEVAHFDFHPQGNLPWWIQQPLNYVLAANLIRERAERLVSQQLTEVFKKAPVWFRRTLDDAA